MAELLVCVKCRAGQEIPESGVRPGQALYDALLMHESPDSVQILPTECVQNCERGCSAVLRAGPEQWTYVYGNLSAVQAEILLEGAVQYAQTADGVIPWRERPEHFKRNCIARIPPMTPKKETFA